MLQGAQTGPLRSYVNAGRLTLSQWWAATVNCLFRANGAISARTPTLTSCKPCFICEESDVMHTFIGLNKIGKSFTVMQPLGTIWFFDYVQPVFCRGKASVFVGSIISYSIGLCNIESEITVSFCSFSLLCLSLRSAPSTEPVSENFGTSLQNAYGAEQEFVEILLKTNFFTVSVWLSSSRNTCSRRTFERHNKYFHIARLKAILERHLGYV